MYRAGYEAGLRSGFHEGYAMGHGTVYSAGFSPPDVHGTSSDRPDYIESTRDHDHRRPTRPAGLPVARQLVPA